MNKLLKIVVLLCVTCALPTPALLAQTGGRAGVFPPTSEEYQILWQKIDSFSQEGDWEAVLEGLEAYSKLFQHPDVNFVVSNGAKTAIGVRELLKRYIGRLPEELRQRWTETGDRILERLWSPSDTLIASDDRKLLRHRLLRDYPFSGLYVSVLKEEIATNFLHGSWERGRAQCAELLEIVRRDGLELSAEDRVQTFVLLLEADRLAGDKGSWDEHRRRLTEVLEKESIDPEAMPESWREPLTSVLHPDAVFETGKDEADAFGGTRSPFVSVDAQTPRSGFRLGGVAWHMQCGPELRRFVAERSTSRGGARRVWTDVPLPYHPVSYGSVVVFQHDDRVVAYDLREERQLWSFYLGPSHVPYAVAKAPLCSSQSCFFVHGQSIFSVAVRSGSPLWSRSIFYDRESKQLVVTGTLEPTVVGDNDGGDGGDKDIERIVEADGNAEGVQDGEPESSDDSSLVPVYGLSPAAHFDGDLILPAAVRVDRETLCYLLRLDQSGEAKWITYIGSSQTSNYLGLGASGSPPCVVGETVVHLTNQGILAAVDGHDGTLLWIKEYSRLSSRGLKESIRDEERWHPNPLVPVPPNLPEDPTSRDTTDTVDGRGNTVDGRGKTRGTVPEGNILVAPQDSPYLLAVRLRDGSTAWRYRRERHSTLLGHDGPRCFLGGLQITAVGLHGASQGRSLWTYSLARHVESVASDSGHIAGPITTAGTRPLGRALLVPGKVLVSTHNTLAHIDTQNGQLLARDLWGFPGGGGNLLLVGSSLAVTHPGGLLVYNDVEAERRRLEKLSPERPETPLEQAKFLLKAGDVQNGLSKLEEWTSMNPENPEPNSSLDRLYLEVAEVIEHVAQAAEGDEKTRLLRIKVNVELRPTRKVTSAVRLAQHLEDNGDRTGALEALHLALECDVPRTEYTPNGALYVPSEAVIRDRILKIRRAETAETAETKKDVFTRLETRASETLESAHKRGKETTIAYLELLHRYPYTRAAAIVYRELATYYLDRENFDNAIHFLFEYLKDFPDNEDVLEIRLWAADLLYQSGKRAEAKKQYLELLESHPEAQISGVHGMIPGETVGRYVRRRLADPGIVEVELRDSPTLRFPVRLLWRSPADLLAINRTFVPLDGDPPAGLDECFLIQSNESVQCRQLETGLPLWIIHLRMTPGFILDRVPFEFRLARTGDRLIQGKFVGLQLVLHDHRNVFGVDPLAGTVRWHVPFGNDTNDDNRVLRAPQLTERIRGVSITGSGVFVVTSRKKLYHVNLNGEKVWEQSLGFEAAPRQAPLAAGGEVFVMKTKRARDSQELHSFNIADGTPTGSLWEFDDIGVHHFSSAPVSLGDGRFLFPYTLNNDCELQLVDLGSRTLVWSETRPRTQIQGLFYSPQHPDEVIATLNRANNLPAVVSISLRDGRELWRYEKFAARATKLAVFRDDDRVYVIHGPDQWKLLALQVSRGADRGRLEVTAAWRPKEVRLTTYYGGSTRNRVIHITDDAIIFPAGNTASIFNKENGKPLTEPQVTLNRFLVDKGTFTSALVRDKLIILSDGGDCAYGTSAAFQGRQASLKTLELVRAYLSSPSTVETIVPLALALFRKDSSKGIVAALELLDRALTSEEVLSTGGHEKREVLAYLLDGLKEEAMKIAPTVQLSAPRLWEKPKIDGELEDAWNYAYRTRIAAPRFINLIAGPGQTRDWEGEEDLSAVLYIGWDDENFYFALDVEDDVLRAHDRDAENWKGDCLLIGIDPDGDGGYHRGAGDQLMTLALTIPKRKKKDKDQDSDNEEDGDDDDDDNDDDDDDDDEKKPEGEFSVKKKEDNSGAVYEVALPWASFAEKFRAEGAPARGTSFGLSLLLADDDTGAGASKTLSLNPCHLLPRSQKQIWIWKYLIPEFFPKVILR